MAVITARPNIDQETKERFPVEICVTEAGGLVVKPTSRIQALKLVESLIKILKEGEQ